MENGFKGGGEGGLEDFELNGGVPNAVDNSGDSEKIVEMNNVDTDLKCESSVGYFEWSKIKSHPWWPGQVYDPNGVSDKAVTAIQKGQFLVANFGDNTLAVGKGSRFDILWNAEKVAFNPEGGVDVCDLLSTSSTHLQESSTHFFGNLTEGEMGDWSLSPERKK